MNDHDNWPVKVARFKVQMKLYSVLQSFVLHIYRQFSVFGALIAVSFTAAVAPCIRIYDFTTDSLYIWCLNLWLKHLIYQ